MSIVTGTKLGQYEVQDFIGQGAMGLVYRAYHMQLARTCAVKVLQGITPDADTMARFRHEARAIAHLRHPNIVNVYDFGEFEGTPYMVVEYVAGGSLANRLSEGALDQATAITYLRGIAAGLDHAHSLGIVHRDVKPANVLLQKDDSPVLADFGLAKILQGSSLKSMTGVTTGTPAYMAPEQVMGHQVGAAADGYSLACIAYEMLTGVIPFDGEGLMELLYAQVHRDPAVPSSRNGVLNAEVDAVLMRGLAKDPGARWESCAAFVGALEEALAGKAVPAGASTLFTTPAVVAAKPLRASVAAIPMTAAPTVPPAARPAYVNGPSRGATVVMPYAAPSPRERKGGPQRRRLTFAAIGVGILLLLLTLGLCAALNPTPALALNPTIVDAGNSVLVTATHLPANQAGQIELFSQQINYPFRADGNGAVSSRIEIPVYTAPGDHAVRICWNSSCHAQKTLLVVAPGTLLFSPSADASPHPGVTPSPTSHATPGPTSQPTPTPRSTPGSTPRPAPSPTQNPCPTSVQPAALAVSATVIGLGSFAVSGNNFTPKASVTVDYYPPNSAVSTMSQTTTVTCGGSFTVTFPAPGIAVLGTAHVSARDTGNRSASKKFTLIL